MRRLGYITAAAAVALVALSCGRDTVSKSTQRLDAYCSAQVIGVGTVDVETDYLPKVISCENGGASFEALKAQAVAARSYLYYRLKRTGDIDDGTGDQVYTCNRPPGMRHAMAAAATSGQVLQYQGTQVAAFYVAGSRQTGPECTGGSDDPTNTERFVTYNQGKSADGIEQTSLGLIRPSNYANRGCKSQNGADCLSDEGWQYDSILRFYYGEDIELVQTVGSCVQGPDGRPDAGADAGDDADAAEGTGGGGGQGDLDGGCSTGGGQAGLLVLLGLLSAAVRPGRRRRRARSVRC